MAEPTHTMWSQTLLEKLYAELHTGADDDKIRGTIRELRAKDLPPIYIVRQVRSKVGDAEAARVERLAFGGVSAGGKRRSKKGGKKLQPGSSRQGLLSGLKKLFEK